METHLISPSRVELTANAGMDLFLKECGTVGKMLRALIRSIRERQ